MNLCTREGCNKPVHGRGLCKNHYNIQAVKDKNQNRSSYEDIANMSVEDLIKASITSTGNKVYDNSRLGNIEKFFLLYSFKKGSIKVPRKIIYDIYSHWSSDPEDLELFNARASKSLHRPHRKDYYLIEEESLHPWIEEGTVTIENGIAKYTEQKEDDNQKENDE